MPSYSLSSSAPQGDDYPPVTPGTTIPVTDSHPTDNNDGHGNTAEERDQQQQHQSASGSTTSSLFGPSPPPPATLSISVVTRESATESRTNRGRNIRRRRRRRRNHTALQPKDRRSPLREECLRVGTKYTFRRFHEHGKVEPTSDSEDEMDEEARMILEEVGLWEV